MKMNDKKSTEMLSYVCIVHASNEMGISDWLSRSMHKKHNNLEDTNTITLINE